MEDNNKKASLIPGVILGSFVTGIILLIVFIVMISRVSKTYQESVQKIYDSYANPANDSEDLLNESTRNKIENIYGIIDDLFYFTDNVDKDKMRDNMYSAILDSLDDKYAEYYTAKEFEELFRDSEGIYYGIGSYVSMDEETGYPKLTGVFEGSPAKAAGLRDGDIITEVNRESILGLTLTEAVNLIKGPENTDVELTIFRENEPSYLYITVTRGKVESPTVVYEMKEDKIGYLQITEFDDITSEQFINAYSDLNNQGMKALIIDLRSNGGGNLSTVLTIAEQILPKGIITYTEDRDGNREEYTCQGKHEIMIPLAVLTNEYTASASELLTGAIRDYGKGTVIGTNTFGKGIVQSVLPLGDGSGIKITTSSYFTPKGECFHGYGIAPDIEVKFDSELYYGEQKRDNQVEYAIDYLKNKIK